MIVIDYKDRRPIYEQVVERFQDLIVKGVIRAGEQMPSVRSLAMELAINPNTIQKAYAELERRGFTYTVKGRGSFVSAREEFLEYTQKEVLESFRNDVDDAKNLQIAKNVLTDIIDRCYEGADGLPKKGQPPKGKDAPIKEKGLSGKAGDSVKEDRFSGETDDSMKEEQLPEEKEVSAEPEQPPEEERSRA
ncbi:MAG: GntR family transcriptional regulator [Lachnospiraceae bacterium]|nr:GntR family transcriptional regulator [Lachnospiraceae bacterium]